MNTMRTLAFSLLLWVAVPALAAAQTSAAQDHLLPVYVQVNDQGQITHMDAAGDLNAGLTRLVRATLEQMITNPAHDKDGHAIASQFIITLSIHSIKQDDDSYKSSMRYVSAKLVPAGNWSWHKNSVTGKIQLVSQDDSKNKQIRRKALNRHRQRAEYAHMTLQQQQQQRQWSHRDD